MKKQRQFRVLAILLVLWSGYLTAQDTEPLFSMDLPSVVATSPESASLGRYGGLSNASATGQMSHNIPLYNIPLKSGGWSVSLGYHFSGLRLEGKPSLSGLGWTLMAGGVVNREVRGLADDSQYGYYGRESKRALVQEYCTSTSNDNTFSLTQMRKFMAKEWDAEPDKYNVSVAGVNFSFKLDENGDAVYLSKHAHKVYTTKNSATFKIDKFRVEASNGVVYTFEEKEQSIPRDSGREEYYDQSLYTDTSWMLSKARYPNGEEVTFNYALDYMHSYDFVAIGNIGSSTLGCNDDCSSPNYTVTGEYRDQTTISTVNRRVLTSMVFPMGSIHFGVSRSAISTPDNRVLYNTMTVKDRQGNVIDYYDFEYEGNRDLLTSIKRKGKHFYDFEYQSKVSMPTFINSVNDKATSQDYWGYYNGAQNQYALTIPKSSYKANRKPSLSNSWIGALKKIIYPTRGYTEISYESNEVRVDNTGADYYASVDILDRVYGVEISGQGSGDAIKEVSIPYTITRPTVGTLSHYISGTRYRHHVTLEMKRVDDTPCPYDQYNVEPAPFYMYYQNPAEIIEEGIQLGNGLGTEIPIMCPEFYEEYGPDDVAYGDDSQNNVSYGVDRIVLLPGRYVLRAYTNTNSLIGFTAKIDLRLEKGWFNPEREELPRYVGKKVGGVRVAAMKDCATSDGDCVERQFSYINEDKFSSGVLNIHPVDDKSYTRQITTAQGARYTNGFHTYSTEFYSVINPAIGTPVYYTAIKETRIDSNQNHGYTVREYETPKIYTIPEYPEIHKGGDVVKNRLTSEKIYRYVPSSDSYALSSASQNEYRGFRNLLDPRTKQDINPKHPWGVTFDRKLFAPVDFGLYSYNFNPKTIEEEEAVKSLYAVSKYKEVNTYHRILNTTRKETLEGKEQHTQQVFEYNPINYEVAKTTSQSGTGKVTESIVTYPSDIINPSAAEQLLLDRNLLTTPIQSEHYLVKGSDKELLSTQHMVYKNWEGEASAFPKPELMQTAQGIITADNPLEDRIVYHKYDYKGNPLEVSRKDGTHVVYIWGYNEYYPIAKIENATYSEVESYVADLKTKSNADIDRTKGYTNTEGDLRQALDNLRTVVPNAIVATYTYDPLIGITSMTDPNGYTTYYEYDDQNRLDHITDANSKILKKYDYNYKGQLSTNYAAVSANLVAPTLVLTNSTANANINISGGSGNFHYAWTLNGQAIAAITKNITHDFISVGEYALACIVTDLVTGQEISLGQNIRVFAPLTTPTLSVSATHTTPDIGTQLTAQISGGSGDLEYKWYVDGVINVNYTTSQISQKFRLPGTYTVKVEVHDKQIPNYFKEASVTIYNHAPLATPRFMVNPSSSPNGTERHYMVGSTVTLTGTNLTGGSGSKRYEWYIDNIKQPNTDITITKKNTVKGYHSFMFKVIDINIPNHVKTGYITLYFHNPISSIGSIQANNGYTITDGQSIPITITSANGGSGDYKYQWFVDNTTHWDQSSTSRTFSFGPSRSSYYTIYCRVIDAKSGYTSGFTSKRIRVTVNQPDGGGGGTRDGDGRDRDDRSRDQQ